MSLCGFVLVLVRACVIHSSDGHDASPVRQTNRHHIPEDCTNLPVAIHLPTSDLLPSKLRSGQTLKISTKHLQSIKIEKTWNKESIES